MFAPILMSVLFCQGGDVFPYTPEIEPPMAYFDVVPQQDVADTFNVGVVAYHLEQVDRVVFTVEYTGLEGDYNWDGSVGPEDLDLVLSNWDQSDGPVLTKVLGNWGSERSISPETYEVREMSLNPRTGQEEYWFPLNTRLHPDSRITVSAEVYPVDGPSVVLSGDYKDPESPRPFYSGVTLFSNNYGMWPVMERWVSPNGSDETGDGTRENPYQGIIRALRHDIPQPGAEVGGTVVYLLPGEHVVDSYSFPQNSFAQADRRYVTITPAPGVSSDDCPIVGAECENGCLLTKGLVRLKNVTVISDQEGILKGGTSGSNATRWYDGCRLTGSVDGMWNNAPTMILGKGGDQYYTDTFISHVREGTTGVIMRNVTLDHIGCDAIELHYAQLLLDILITNHNAAPTTSGCHVDYMQYNGIDYTHQNVVLRDIYGNHSCRQQGVHACPGQGAVHNTAWVRVELSNTGGNGLEECSIPAVVWRWCGPSRNNLFKDCILVQKQQNLGDKHSTFSFKHLNDDGTRNTEGPWTVLDDGSYRFVNVKIEDCYENWEKTQPWFPKPDAGAPWAFYGPDELMWDPDARDDVQPNPFSVDEPWFSQITGVYYTQTK